MVFYAKNFLKPVENKAEYQNLWKKNRAGYPTSGRNYSGTFAHLTF